jgi:hypothetical protein
LVDKYKPTVVAQVDTNTVVAPALTGAKKQVPFAHVEAGQRSWDRTMPEEINRIVADAVARLCFAPTALAAVNLMHEGVPTSRIRITGNTIVDVLHSYRDIAVEEGEKMLKELGLQPHSYVLVTIHRQENTDNPERLQSLVKALAKISQRCIDEELRLGSIDAGIVGTPVAKLTHPLFVERQDYKDEVLWAASPREFVELMSEYLRDAEDNKPIFTRRFREFLLNRRSWDKVKTKLIRLLR